VNLACRKAKELGYPHELWTTRLLARHAHEQGTPSKKHGFIGFARRDFWGDFPYSGTRENQPQREPNSSTSRLASPPTSDGTPSVSE
jgi:hypothetical protein